MKIRKYQQEQFHLHYRRSFILRTIDRYDAGVQVGDVYKIDQLEAMRLAFAAWGKVTANTIQHCFKHTQIMAAQEVEETVDDDMYEAERLLNEMMDTLQIGGLVHQLNRMSLEDILTDQIEMVLSSADEIYGSLINGVEEEEAEIEMTDEPVPTYKELMKMSTDFQRKMAYTNTLDNPESILEKALSIHSQVGGVLRKHQCKTMTSRKITDFFTQNDQ